MKELEGCEVYLMPTGNNARRGLEKKLKGVIVKVARVFVTFTIEGSSMEHKSRFRGLKINGDFNSGYVVFKSEKDIDEHFESAILSRKISDYFEYSHTGLSLEIKKLRSIAEILEVI